MSQTLAGTEPCATKPSDARTTPRWRRYLVRGMIALVAAYFGVLVLLVLFEDLLVFPGTPAWLGWAHKPVPGIQDVELRGPAGNLLHAWYLPCEKPRAHILFLHGSGGNLSFAGPLMIDLRKRLGCASLAIDYPGYGKSEGWCSEQGCYDAADAAYDWLLQQGVKTGDLVILGDSLGGAVAVDLASRRDHRSLVLVKTFTTLPDAASHHYGIYPVQSLMRNRFPSIDKIGRCSKPILLVHGTSDTLVPHFHSGLLCDAARAPKRLVFMEGEGHCLHFPEPLWQSLETFLAE